MAKLRQGETKQSMIEKYKNSSGGSLESHRCCNGRAMCFMRVPEPTRNREELTSIGFAVYSILVGAILLVSFMLLVTILSQIASQAIHDTLILLHVEVSMW